MSIESKVKKIIAKKLDIDLDCVVLEASFVYDLGADSLAIVDLTMEIEDKFQLNISYEDAQKIFIVKDLIDYVRKA